MYDAQRQVKEGKELRPAGQGELVVRQYESSLLGTALSYPVRPTGLVFFEEH